MGGDYRSQVRQRLVYLAGAMSRTGDAERQLAGLVRYIGSQARLEDAVEASYRSGPDGSREPYDRSDTSQPLIDSVEAVARTLGRHRRELGLGGKLHLLGWSLGGAVLFEAAVKLVDADPAWRDGFGAIVTLSSPLNGCDVDGIEELGVLAAGQAGRELIKRGGDPLHRQWVFDGARRLRAAGIRLLTLGTANDVVVTANDSVVPEPGRSPDEYVVVPRARLGADFGERHLGHGAILHDPAVWRRVLSAVTGEE
jgi:pimeloyl-ACP methyl ester carboxylesterase